MDEKTVTIERLVFGGKGLSRDLQKVLFVPFTLPGEKVRVRVHREHRDYTEGNAIEILEPHSKRVVPECRYFGRCGGCQISHAEYGFQLKLKETMLLESLKRQHLNPPKIQIVKSIPFQYRHRARFKYDPRQRQLGFLEPESNHIVDIKECLCLSSGLNVLLKALRSVLADSEIPRLSQIECYENEKGETATFFNSQLPAHIKNSLKSKTQVVEAGEIQDSPLLFKFREFQFPMQPDIFLQVNPLLLNAMVQEVESHHEKSLDLVGIELYCGAGFFTLPLAKKFKKIIACEENVAALQYARKHYSDRNIEWVCKKAEQFNFPSDASAAVLDPPRAGLSKKIVESLLRHPFQKISYISCDPSTFARDARALSGHYRLAQLTLLDLFPQTFHFETIALFEQVRG